MKRITSSLRSPLPTATALAAALALGACPLQAVMAQAAPDSAQAQAETGSTGQAGRNASQLETVVVTAERRVANIKDVPTAVATVSGDALDALNASGEDVRALSGRVPSLNIESSFGRAFPRFYIRGYGNTDFHLNASQPVSLVYDDVVQENPILKGFPVFDVKAVEVLAGPQGTLFGRNTPAGVVKFDSVAPSHADDGYVNLGFGNLGTINAEVAANIPMQGEWAVRISAQQQHRDNWVTNTFAGPQETHSTEGYNDRAVRVQALYQPNADFSALFNIHNRELDGSPRLFRAGIIQPGTNDLIAGFDPYKMSIDGDNVQRVHATGANARLKWKFNDFDLYSITAIETVQPFSRGDVDGGSSYTNNFVIPPDKLLPSSQLMNVGAYADETSDALYGHRQLTQEFRLESKQPGPLSWQTGLFIFNEHYRWENIDYSSTSTYGGTSAPLLAETTQGNQAYAIFGSANYQLTSDLKLGGGVRYSLDNKQINAWAPAVNGQTLNFNAPGPHSGTSSDSKWTWDASAVYALDKNTNVYFKTGTGFRASTILPLAEFSPQTQAGPETIMSYELGIKGDFWHKRARLSADVYYFDVSNQQLTAVGGGANGNSVTSVKDVIGSGAELNLDLIPIDNMLVHLSGSYNDARIHDANLSVPGCSGGCTMLNPQVGTTGMYLVNGNQLPNAPRWVGNLNLRYGIPTEAGNEFYVYTDWTYRSSENFFIYRSVEFTGKALTEGGLRGGYIWNNGKYEVAGYVRNITNTIVVTGAIDFNNLTGFINDPRTYGVQFKALF
ncbi:MAG: TonB-dependent receptor [Burkholderiaceae bacterium]|nr:TonB-dependent receptor [Roseateles sp.]MBV8469624.1 TonB-dependent receptor [Burkholderiaceae bacterium]